MDENRDWLRVYKRLTELEAANKRLLSEREVNTKSFSEIVNRLDARVEELEREVNLAHAAIDVWSERVVEQEGSKKGKPSKRKPITIRIS